MVVSVVGHWLRNKIRGLLRRSILFRFVFLWATALYVMCTTTAVLFCTPVFLIFYFLRLQHSWSFWKLLPFPFVSTYFAPNDFLTLQKYHIFFFKRKRLRPTDTIICV
ncbi:hypothetical protein, unlikely [Trypanosoma brucei gambiense DAL972]|uniref:Uncharacterized protein n=1 Tax=Trypanosoma brucei gambiense (strain MHOM/CI/86/DAL972) TaxID=679716 RepID=C9ZVY3_TRYB9|nr:hypothetical protein, unlikely [Trypanosoma brucei gambiense DAL972]CBH13571.1 hypothetical protein, unlikely [Trypanosoma brucei gambiense DAL972]|eukprot:XP_011775848.1 hypothetical protein, unlikely [Trypanosoma brucei gambiense DAL972]